MKVRAKDLFDDLLDYLKSLKEECTTRERLASEDTKELYSKAKDLFTGLIELVENEIINENNYIEALLKIYSQWVIATHFFGMAISFDDNVTIAYREAMSKYLREIYEEIIEKVKNTIKLMMK